MKADKMDLERLFEIKCNKEELDSLLGAQSTMHMQFKHILSLFIEIVNLFAVTKPDESQQTV